MQAKKSLKNFAIARSDFNWVWNIPDPIILSPLTTINI